MDFIEAIGSSTTQTPLELGLAVHAGIFVTLAIVLLLPLIANLFMALVMKSVRKPAYWWIFVITLLATIFSFFVFALVFAFIQVPVLALLQ